MSAEMKYIIVSLEYTDAYKRELPVVFPSLLPHEYVASLLINNAPSGLKMSIVSAGFVETAFKNTFGRSDKLHLQARDKDINILRMHGYGYGITDTRTL